jgi:hypothetical protein
MESGSERGEDDRRAPLGGEYTGGSAAAGAAMLVVDTGSTADTAGERSTGFGAAGAAAGAGAMDTSPVDLTSVRDGRGGGDCSG